MKTNPDICIPGDVVVTRGGSGTENILWVNVKNLMKEKALFVKSIFRQLIGL